jgi:hypothetical protein
VQKLRLIGKKDRSRLKVLHRLNGLDKPSVFLAIQLTDAGESLTLFSNQERFGYGEKLDFAGG